MKTNTENKPAEKSYFETCFGYESLQEKRERLIKRFGPTALKEMQEMIDSLREDPKYKKYVNDHKLHLIDERMKAYDVLLSLEILK